jgi:hypothetical protein
MLRLFNKTLRAAYSFPLFILTHCLQMMPGQNCSSCKKAIYGGPKVRRPKSRRDHFSHFSYSPILVHHHHSSSSFHDNCNHYHPLIQQCKHHAMPPMLLHHCPFIELHSFNNANRKLVPSTIMMPVWRAAFAKSSCN